MADTSAELASLRAQFAKPAQPCLRCVTHDALIPTEIQLRQLVSDEGIEMEKFVPRAGTAEQTVALAAYSHALTLMLKAYGLEITGARVNRTWAMLRVFAQLRRIGDRVDAARVAIQADIRARYDRGEIGPAEANDIAQATPTPDYDGRDRDEAWLQRVMGVGVDAL